MAEMNAEIRCGRTDGFRYIAYSPPLTEEELHSVEINNRAYGHVLSLVDEVVLGDGRTVTVTQYNVERNPGIGRDERLAQVASWLGGALRRSRSSEVVGEVVSMPWGEQTPFLQASTNE